MARKLKALGLAFFAAFAMSAVAASAASANPLFRSNSAPTFLTAESIGTQEFTTTVGELNCESVSLQGTSIAEQTTDEITAHPEYDDCLANIENTEFEFTVDFTSCDYLFTSTLEGQHAPVHIECVEPGDHIDIDLIIFETPFPCVQVPEQTPTAGGVTYTNQEITPGVRDVRVDATVSGITYTEVAFSPCNEGETAVAHDGVYNGSATVTGFKDAAHTEHADVWVE